MFVRCRSTVRTLRRKRSAIDWFVRPCDTSRSTWSSRALRPTAVLGSAGLVSVPRNASISETNTSQAGSCSSRIWFAESSRTKCASGISAASSRPSSDRDHPVVPRMQHERARTDLRRKITDVQAATRTVQRGRGLGSRRTPEQVLIPGHLLRRAVRQEQHAEHPAERRIRRRPAWADRGDDGLFFGVLAAEPPAARVSDTGPCGRPGPVPCRIRHRDRCRLGDAEQRESLQAHRIDDRFKIADPHVGRRIADVRIRKPAASLVISDEGVPVAELLQPMAPDGAFPVELEMTEPGRDPDEWRTGPMDGISQTHAVPSRAKAHVLLHTLTVQLTLSDREPQVKPDRPDRGAGIATS